MFNGNQEMHKTSRIGSSLTTGRLTEVYILTIRSHVTKGKKRDELREEGLIRERRREGEENRTDEGEKERRERRRKGGDKKEKIVLNIVCKSSMFSGEEKVRGFLLGCQKS